MQGDKITEFYIDTLNRMPKEDLGEKKPEATLLHDLAFAGLLRHGISTSYVQGADGSRIVCMELPDGTSYQCPEKRLPNISGGQYDSSGIRSGIQQPVTNDPVAYDPSLKPQQPQPSPQQPQPAPVPVKMADRQQEPEGTVQMAHGATVTLRAPWEAFLYEHHVVALRLGENSGTIHFYVYPLERAYDQLDAEIVVVAESGELLSAGVCSGTGPCVEVSYEGLHFLARGRFEKGVFSSVIEAVDPDIQSAMQVEKELHDDGAGPYCGKYGEGALWVLPAKTKWVQGEGYVPVNGSNGFASCALYLEVQGKTYLSVSDYQGILTIKNGQTVRNVEAYWTKTEASYELILEIR